MRKKPWLVYTLVTMIFWGVWGALSELPEKEGFPATLGYVVWAITMVIPALITLKLIAWKPETHRKGILNSLIIGLTGSAGQLILFQALKQGPAYLVFPIVSLSPLVTIFLSLLLLKEKASVKSWFGIIIAIIALPLLSYQPMSNNNHFGSFWLLFALLVFLAWGVQAYFIKVANTHMKAESIFFYMTLSSISLIPVALVLTDFNENINWYPGSVMAAGIQLLNSIGALFIVYAFRHGKAIIVSPMINAGAPLITISLSLLIYQLIPHPVIISGLALSILAVILLSD